MTSKRPDYVSPEDERFLMLCEARAAALRLLRELSKNEPDSGKVTTRAIQAFDLYMRSRGVSHEAMVNIFFKYADHYATWK